MTAYHLLLLLCPLVLISALARARDVEVFGTASEAQTMPTTPTHLSIGGP